MEFLQSSGSLGSSFRKPSSLVLCRTMPGRRSFPLIPSALASRCVNLYKCVCVCVCVCVCLLCACVRAYVCLLCACVRAYVFVHVCVFVVCVLCVLARMRAFSSTTIVRLKMGSMVLNTSTITVACDHTCEMC